MEKKEENIRLSRFLSLENEYDFMISDNGVWQIAHVPPQYLERMESDLAHG